MKIFLPFIGICLIAASMQIAHAVLDGRATVITVENTYTFSDGEYALGFVHFKNGFTVPAGQKAYVGVIPRVNGPIDLNQTGVLYLSAPLRLGPAATGFTNGGAICTNDGNQGVITMESNTDLTKQLVFKNSMVLDLGSYALTLRGDGASRGSLMIDNTVSQTVMLRNGWLRGVQDFTTGFGPRLRATTPTAGRHGFHFKDLDVRFTLEGTMTGTGYDLMFSGYKNVITGLRSSLIHLRAGLYLNDLTNVTLNPGLELRLNTTLTSSYFSIGHGSSLTLDAATFSYNKALTLPAPYLAKNMISAINVNNTSILRGLGEGSDAQVTIGADSSYDYDAFIDVAPHATLVLDNVLLVNNNQAR
ncbi:hypothetical protein EBZ39_07115 [bacterium]|nr:hypothetical protein [bacterium]